MAISQVITFADYPTAADPTNFNARGDATHNALETMATDVNTLISEINALEINVNDLRVDAQQWAADAATARGVAEGNRDLARLWSEQVLDLEVTPGKYSAKHWKLTLDGYKSDIDAIVAALPGAPGIPSVAGYQGYTFVVNASEDGAGWGSPSSIGEIIWTADTASYSSPAFLECDGSSIDPWVYDQVELPLAASGSTLPKFTRTLLGNAYGYNSLFVADGYVLVLESSTNTRGGIIFYDLTGRAYTEAGSFQCDPSVDFYSALAVGGASGEYVAVSWEDASSNRYVDVYFRSGLSLTLLNRISNGTMACQSLSFSADGGRLAIGYGDYSTTSNSPGFKLYDRTGSDAGASFAQTYHKILTRGCGLLSVSPDGDHIAYAYTNGSSVFAYVRKMTADTDTLLSSTAYFPLALTYAPAGNILINAISNTNTIVFTVSGDTYSVVGSSGINQQLKYTQFSSDGLYVISYYNNGVDRTGVWKSNGDGTFTFLMSKSTGASACTTINGGQDLLITLGSSFYIDAMPIALPNISTGDARIKAFLATGET